MIIEAYFIRCKITFRACFSIDIEAVIKKIIL